MVSLSSSVAGLWVVRENTSQVYLPRERATQTNVARGTNPPRTFTYLAGLRHSVVKELGEQPRPLHRSVHTRGKKTRKEGAGKGGVPFEGLLCGDVCGGGSGGVAWCLWAPCCKCLMRFFDAVSPLLDVQAVGVHQGAGRGG
jgi:hypothetical protein